MDDTRHPEWDTLVEDWQSSNVETPPVSLTELRRRVYGQNIRLTMIVSLEILISIGIIAFCMQLWSEYPRSDTLIGIFGIWGFLAFTWGFALWNRHGIWQAESQTTQGLIELLYQRAVRQLRTARYCVWLLISEVLFISFWVWWKPPYDTPIFVITESAALRWGIIFTVVIGYIIWIIWFRHRALSELDRLSPLRMGSSNDRG
jgi:hypothetical protein